MTNGKELTNHINDEDAFRAAKEAYAKSFYGAITVKLAEAIEAYLKIPNAIPLSESLKVEIDFLDNQLKRTLMQEERLQKTLRRLSYTPAVVQALGKVHTDSCACPLCEARNLLHEYENPNEYQEK